MDWQLLDCLFAGVLLLGLWALAAILGAGGHQGSAPPATPAWPITGGRAPGAC